MIQQQLAFGSAKRTGAIIYAFEDIEQLAGLSTNENQLDDLKVFFEKNESKHFYRWENNQLSVFVHVKKAENPLRQLEAYRIQGSSVLSVLESFASENVFIKSIATNLSTAFAEGLALSAYRFDHYKKKKTQIALKYIGVDGISDADANRLSWIVTGNFVARDMINEPLIKLTAQNFSDRVVSLGKQVGFNVEVLNKANIEALRMGGLLGVNKGSVDPPTFSIMEYKPEKPRNAQPLVLVGKGVMYDTGGLSLKPTAGSMDSMKSDMSGAAAVAGTLTALAGMKSDIWVIGLVPATDNRPGGNAITPGDILHMFDGTTVEVLNTDAEGRLILGDALAFAKKYNPALVIDLATLTGAAVIAAGRQAICAMGNVDDTLYSKMEIASHEVHERLVRLPLWPEYAEMIKSTVADLKNIGGREAGTITAGKFLEHFTSYPWVHLDIAASAFLDRADAYRPEGGTGAGVRLLCNFALNHFEA
ncbi:MAG: peptidase M17 [Flavobacteriales bacterium]|nr:MAG: peptidase M17 [Flavobacteriales bacterium]